MSRRRRLSPPLIPGFWPLMAALFLLGCLFGTYYVLAKTTRFARQPDEVDPKPSAKAK